MMRLFFFLFFSFLAHADIELEKTVSISAPVKKEADVKAILVHAAVLDTLEQFEKDLNVDSKKIKDKLAENFSASFESFKERKMVEKFGKNYATNLTEEQKKTFLDGIETGRQLEFARFAKLDRLLDSYAFKQVGNEPNSTTDWKGIIFLKLNSKKVEDFYARLESNETKQYSSIQILTEVTPMGFSWTDLALEKSASITHPMMDSWLKWFSSNHPGNVEEILLCNEGCLDDFSSWQLIPQEEGMSVPQTLLNGLWLKISFNLKKVSHLKGINEWTFEWDGSVVLLDVNTKKILFSYSMKTETKTWRGLDQKTLNSALVTAMYRSPLDALNKVVRKIQETPRLNHLGRLIVQGHRNMGDVLLLSDLLKKEGSRIGLELSPDLFTRSEAQLLCFYQGEEKSFTDLLSQLKELKSSHSYKLVNEFNGIHHVLKLIAE